MCPLCVGSALMWIGGAASAGELAGAFALHPRPSRERSPEPVRAYRLDDVSTSDGAKTSDAIEDASRR